MTKQFSFSIKFLLYFLIIVMTFGYMFYVFLNHILKLLSVNYGILIYPIELVQGVPLTPVIVCVVVVCGLSLYIAIDSIYFIRRLNINIKESLEDRKLSENFSQFHSASSFKYIGLNLKNLLSLYKSFDNMKSARVVLETATIKQLMNSVSEGIMLVNKKLVTTHINHIAENHLGFIPGEVLGQSISRKTDNTILLDSLEKVFDINHKFLDLDLKEDQLQASIYPLKDKFGDVIRALIIIKKSSAKDTIAEKNTDNDN